MNALRSERSLRRIAELRSAVSATDMAVSFGPLVNRSGAVARTESDRDRYMGMHGTNVNGGSDAATCRFVYNCGNRAWRRDRLDAGVGPRRQGRRPCEWLRPRPFRGGRHGAVSRRAR